MLIQPIEPVAVTIKMGKNSYECQMVSLSESELALKSYDYFEKGSEVLFLQNIFEVMPLYAQ